mmetsp:Transcript_24858/g.86583  ORF Transcript_24858/g.86583 Transcript_24858/m.86583 type:complete len:541 (-) Transcript_24858:1302-2924(-)
MPGGAADRVVSREHRDGVGFELPGSEIVPRHDGQQLARRRQEQTVAEVGLRSRRVVAHGGDARPRASILAIDCDGADVVVEPPHDGDGHDVAAGADARSVGPSEALLIVVAVDLVSHRLRRARGAPAVGVVGPLADEELKVVLEREHEAVAVERGGRRDVDACRGDGAEHAVEVVGGARGPATGRVCGHPLDRARPRACRHQAASGSVEVDPAIAKVQGAVVRHARRLEEARPRLTAVRRLVQAHRADVAHASDRLVVGRDGDEIRVDVHRPTKVGAAAGRAVKVAPRVRQAGSVRVAVRNVRGVRPRRRRVGARVHTHDAVGGDARGAGVGGLPDRKDVAVTAEVEVSGACLSFVHQVVRCRVGEQALGGGVGAHCVGDQGHDDQQHRSDDGDQRRRDVATVLRRATAAATADPHGSVLQSCLQRLVNTIRAPRRFQLPSVDHTRGQAGVVPNGECELTPAIVLTHHRRRLRDGWLTAWARAASKLWSWWRACGTSVCAEDTCSQRERRPGVTGTNNFKWTATTRRRDDVRTIWERSQS